MFIEEEEYLAHYGILRKSGRYPWGSGDNVQQRSMSFLDYVDDLKKRLGWSDVEVAKGVGMSTTELRAARAIAKNQVKASQIAMAQGLKDKGTSNVEIGKRMGLNESSVRALLAPGTQDKADVLTATANMLRANVDEKRLLDVGSGVENHIGVSKERKDTAIAMLQEEGYRVHYIKVTQVGTGKETTIKVLTPPGTTYSDVYKNRGDIKTITNFSDDGGRSYYGIVDPLSISPKRVAVNYAETGGANLDGVIYVRPGVKDVDLGGSRYAQVRVKVGDTHYAKGMAIYKDDLPEGVDLMINTNKPQGTPMMGAKDHSVLKGIKDDPDNPFGSYVRRQIIEKGKDGTDKATSVMNIVNEEGNWDTWSKTIASQVLSKQSPELAKSQLGVTWERRQRDYNEILSLTNPTVRKKLLDQFADETDSAAVHLKAAALPRQRWQVILPIDSLPDTEIFAPNFRDGERVALIRYPHGGTFEIPELTVNNRHRDSIKILGKQARDAVGINSNVAQRLSGADFDGDTVLVIPNNQGRIKSSPSLKGLKGFDPVSAYPAYEGMPRISESRKQKEMGDVSNLIADMTIQGASHTEIARAVRHSMVVIDSEKHNLNYKLSAEENGIKALKEKYQGGARAGAATLITRAKSPVRVLERIPRRASNGGPVDPVTGKRVYELTNRTYTNKAGDVVPSTTRSRRLAEVDDAAELSSGTPMERIYVEHSNRLKGLANEARLASIKTPRSTYSPSAAKTYASQVESLNAQLNLALRNRPLERQAQVLADAQVRLRKQANPNMDADTLKKIKSQTLIEARRRTGAEKQRIEISQAEWDAIQAGAISDSKLSTILDNADMDTVKALATPKTPLLMSTAMTRRAEAMLKSGYTRSEIADQLGVSLTTLDRATVDGN